MSSEKILQEDQTSPELEFQSTRKNDECAVSKWQLLPSIRAQFQMADRDRDGRLNISELKIASHPKQ